MSDSCSNIDSNLTQYWPASCVNKAVAALSMSCSCWEFSVRPISTANSTLIARKATAMKTGRSLHLYPALCLNYSANRQEGTKKTHQAIVALLSVSKTQVDTAYRASLSSPAAAGWPCRPRCWCVHEEEFRCVPAAGAAVSSLCCTAADFLSEACPSPPSP